MVVVQRRRCEHTALSWPQRIRPTSLPLNPLECAENHWLHRVMQLLSQPVRGLDCGGCQESQGYAGLDLLWLREACAPALLPFPLDMAAGPLYKTPSVPLG